MNDKQIISGIKKDAYSSFTLLYDKYFPRLFGFVLKITRSENQTKEIVQETFLKVWENRFKLDENSSVQSYIFTIAKNKLINEFRKTLNFQYFDDYMQYCNSVEYSTDNISKVIDKDYFQELMTSAKKKLTKRQLEIFELNKEQDLSITEISSKLSISEQVVRNQLSKAMNQIKKEVNTKKYEQSF
jgi:RNA polymerase sigma-70 factor (ECF subfamily)